MTRWCTKEGCIQGRPRLLNDFREQENLHMGHSVSLVKQLCVKGGWALFISLCKKWRVETAQNVTARSPPSLPQCGRGEPDRDSAQSLLSGRRQLMRHMTSEACCPTYPRASDRSPRDDTAKRKALKTTRAPLMLRGRSCARCQDREWCHSGQAELTSLGGKAPERRKGKISSSRELAVTKN